MKRKRIKTTTTTTTKNTSTRVSCHGWKPLMPMMLSTWMKLWGSLTTFVKTKRKHPWSKSLRTIRVRVAWNCLESTSSFPEVEVAIISTFWLSYMEMIEILLGLIRASRLGDWMLHLASVRAMIPCFAWWHVELCPLSSILLRPDVSAAHSQHRCARWIHAMRVFSSAWLQQPLRKNSCRSNDRRNDVQGHADARGTNGLSL